MVDVKLFSGTKSKYLAEEIADYYGHPLGKLEVQRFSDGEMQPVIQESVRGGYVFFIQSTFAPSDNLMELLLMIDISAKLIANLLQAAGADRVMTMDLHAPQIQGFFDIPVDHLKCEAIFIPYLQKYLNLENAIFAAPDVGGVKRARTYSKYFHKSLVICDKERRKANEIASMTVIGDVQGADVIMVDDIVDTAGTLSRAADIIMEKGAKSVRALCTHPVLSGKAYENIENSKIKELIVCNTLPLKKKSKKIKVLSTAKLFSKAIRNTHEHRSISALFVEG